MAKKQTEAAVEVQPVQIGETVLWRGIPLVVKEIYPDGRIMAWSQTLMVTATGPEHFEKVSNYGG